ncbi:LAMI_0G12178g1_1 [Lachancea mirantina]|uniref:LAMI_0G12178g1_1 n=1 Tax=Lachancea mirantina TaxID=1230905 RepID=A0A1G4KB88_9SACH|nr:LAMI_0G12178g1_1 [Lachancea mirantina]
MKFAEHLRESVIPEWSDKYIDYKLGKKKLKSCREGIAASRVLVNNIAASRSFLIRQGTSGLPTPTNIPSHFVKEFIDDWLIAQELEKCNEFYVWQLRRCLTQYEILKEQMRMYELQCHVTAVNSFAGPGPEYGTLQTHEHDPISPMATKGNWRTKVGRFLQDNDLKPSLPKFITIRRLLNKSPVRASETGRGEMFTPLNLNKRQIKERISNALIDFYLLTQLVKSYRELNVTGFRKIVKKFDKTCQTHELPRFLADAKVNYELFRHAEAYAQSVAQQMHEASLLKSSVTTTKKPDHCDDPLSNWEAAVTKWYTEIIPSTVKDRKHNASKLRHMSLQYSLSEHKVHRVNSVILQIFVGGLALGASFGLVAFTLYRGFKANSNSDIHHFLLPLWGGWYLIFLMSLFLVIDCFIWHRTNINYRFIMFGEIHSRHGAVLFNNDFSTTNIALLVYFVGVLFLPLAILSTVSFHYERLSPSAIIWAVTVVVLFFWPARKFKLLPTLPFWKQLLVSKRWLMTTAIRLIFSGFFPVQFGDFFLGDIVCSLTYSMADISLFFCYYTSNPLCALCGSSHSKSMAALSALPSFWRFLQCLRRFSDSGDAFPHLWNALKYAMGVAYNGSLGAYRMSHASSKKQGFIVLATLNSLVTSLWDIVIDWSLLQPGSRNWLLRDDLYLAGRRNWRNGAYSSGKRSIYYLAMIWDVLIRFEWIVYAAAPQTIQQSAVTSLVLAALEVGRRFVWVIFRVENEHVANVHLFKVTGETSLPYPSTITPDSDSNSILDGHYAMSTVISSEASDKPKPEHGESRHSFFRTASNTIPWAHAQDFQRPTGNSGSERAIESDESESEVESMV